MRFEYGDGRRMLAREETRYDVIEADAVLPQTSHSGLLYSAEFLEQVRARLAKGGLYVQWAPTARVVETFVSVFPHAVLLQPFPVLIGSNDPIPFDHAKLLARLADPAVLAHARRGNPAITSLAQEVAGPAYAWTPRTEREPAPLTDMFPRTSSSPTMTTCTAGSRARRARRSRCRRRGWWRNGSRWRPRAACGADRSIRGKL